MLDLLSVGLYRSNYKFGTERLFVYFRLNYIGCEEFLLSLDIQVALKAHRVCGH